MMRRIAAVPALCLLLSCASAPAPEPPTRGVAPAAADRHSILLSADGARFWVSTPGPVNCTIAEYAIDGREQRTAEAPCGTLRLTPEGLLVVSPTGGASTLLPFASFEPERSPLVDQAGEARLEQRGQTLVWRTAGAEIELAPTLRAPRLLRSGAGIVAIETGDGGERLVRLEADSSIRVLFDEPGLQVDSFDIEPSEREIVFSAGAGRPFHVGIASLTGGDSTWLPREPGHEHSVSWAPRGNKVTWFIDRADGTVMRTLHVPTGFQLSVPFPGARVMAHAWDPPAERIFAVVDAAAHAPATISVRYGGEDRKIVIEPDERLGREADLLAGTPSPAIVYAPERITYGRRYPATILVTPEGVTGWSSLAHELASDPERGVIRISSPALVEEKSFLRELGTLSWLDPRGIEMVISSPGGRRSSRSVVLLD